MSCYVFLQFNEPVETFQADKEWLGKVTYTPWQVIRYPFKTSYWGYVLKTVDNKFYVQRYAFKTS